MNITDFPSPNFGPRRGVAAPDMIVIHYTGMASAALALARLCNPAAEVSAHYLIDEQGAVFRLVTEARRAWHAGVAAWGRATDVNSHSIGIELSHPGHGAGNPEFAEAQMAALETLIGQIRLRWSIPKERVLGHSDVAVGRKIDPGERFDWARLAAKGLAVASRAEGEAGQDGDPAALCAGAARRLGYAWEDEADLIRALQMRLCPEETGQAPSPRLAARAVDLAARHPVSEGRKGGPELPDGSAPLDD